MFPCGLIRTLNSKGRAGTEKDRESKESKNSILIIIHGALLSALKSQKELGWPLPPSHSQIIHILNKIQTQILIHSFSTLSLRLIVSSHPNAPPSRDFSRVSDIKDLGVVFKFSGFNFLLKLASHLSSGWWW